MPRTTTMTVSLSGSAKRFVAANVGDGGSYENVSEYIRDLICRHKERDERRLRPLAPGLTRALAAPAPSVRPLTAADGQRRASATDAAWRPGPGVRLRPQRRNVALTRDRRSGRTGRS